MAPKQRDTRFPIKLPPWHEKRLIYWAYCKGTTKTQLAQNTLQARIEANEPQIDTMMREVAAELGMTLTELQKVALEKGKYTPPERDEEDDDDEGG